MKTFLKYLLRVLVLALVLTVLVPAFTTRAEATGTSVPDALPASSLDTTLLVNTSSFSVSLKLNSFPEGTRLLVMAGYRGGKLVTCDFIPPIEQTLDLSKYSPLSVDTLKLLCLGDNYRPLTFPKQIFPLDHSHSVVTAPGAEPDCVNPGYGETQYCADCGEVFSLGAEISPLGHDICTVEGYAPSCTEWGLSDEEYCSRCGETFSPATAIEPSGHPEESVTVRKGTPASCTESGISDELYCGVCDTVFQSHEYIAPLGHDTYIVEGYAPTCSDWGRSDGEYCSRCNATLKSPVYTEPVRHTWYDEKVVGNYIERKCACGCVAKDSLNAASLDYEIVWNKYVGYICTITGIGTYPSGDLVIPDHIEGYPVKIIGEGAFKNNKDITSVTLSDNVNQVRESAFANCTNLQWAQMPHVLGIYDGAFIGCEKLYYVYIPQLDTIGEAAFGRCFSLNYIELPDTLDSIGTQAFANCGIRQIVIPYGVKKIAPNAFELLGDMVIYCEIDSKPFGWSEGWDFGNYDGTMCTVYWNYREEGDERPIHNFCDWYELEPETETTGRVMERFCYDCWEYENYYFEKKKVYYGTSTDPFLVDGAGLEWKYIERKDEPFTVYADKGEYIYYYSPTEWGKCTFHWGGWVLDIPLFGAYYIDGTEYYVYCFTNTGLGDITAFCT